MSPCSPVPVTAARSTPRSLASLRTGGVDRGRSADWGAAACLDRGAARRLNHRGGRDRLNHRGGRGNGKPPGRRSCGRGGPDGRNSPGRRRSQRGSVRAWRARPHRQPEPAAGPPSSPSTSKETIGLPTSTTVPGCSCRAATTPANGEGSSTTALAVSTSAMIWLSATVSPTATFHATISDSVRPSPRSGSLNSLIMVALILPARSGSWGGPGHGRRRPGSGPDPGGGAFQALSTGTGRRSR